MESTDYLDDIVATVRQDMESHLGRGKVADYIPALARVDPKNFAIAIATCDGRTAQAGGVHLPFSIQSISKIFTLTLALNKLGANLWERVGREPSGSRFNSIVQLEAEKGIPRNPLINAGAVVITDALLDGGDADATIAEILGFMRRLADDPAIVIDDEVAESEAQTGFRNSALANFLRANENLKSKVEDVLKVYFNQCAIRMNCRQLARAGLYLANAGHDPLNHASVTTPFRAKRINAVMMTCGHYDASGDFACRVGLPGKSGVGGGILAIAPRKASICVWSPGLNAQGNSMVGSMALERLSSLTGWSVF
ncbi:MAG: glutaminase [Alphaproteobacteria bacterium]|nr:glutaminase [Alphaproteobacteria bacterium]